MQSICEEINNSILTGDADSRHFQTWEQLLLFFSTIPTGGWRTVQKRSVGMFLRQIKRLVRSHSSGLFPETLADHETTIEDIVLNVKKKDFHVIDYALLKRDEHNLVVGDFMQSLFELKISGAGGRTEKSPIPKVILVYIDELNKFAPRGDEKNPLLRWILEISERGRSDQIVLVSASQFPSRVEERVTGNTATKFIGRTAEQEAMQSYYSFLTRGQREGIKRLRKGEMIVAHDGLEQPVRIKFPDAFYHQPGH
jgi:DNA helicase HerA-like ATPase